MPNIHSLPWKRPKIQLESSWLSSRQSWWYCTSRYRGWKVRITAHRVYSWVRSSDDSVLLAACTAPWILWMIASKEETSAWLFCIMHPTCGIYSSMSYHCVLVDNQRNGSRLGCFGSLWCLPDQQLLGCYSRSCVLKHASVAPRVQLETLKKKRSLSKHPAVSITKQNFLELYTESSSWTINLDLNSNFIQT